MDVGEVRQERSALALVGESDSEGRAKIVYDIIKLSHHNGEPKGGTQAPSARDRDRDGDRDRDNHNEDRLSPDVVEARPPASKKEVFLIGLIPVVFSLAIAVVTLLLSGVGLEMVRQRVFDPADPAIQQSYNEGEFFPNVTIIMYAILILTLVSALLFIQSFSGGLLRVMYAMMAVLECFALTITIVVVLKFAVAKLRPDFLDRCLPDGNLVCTNPDTGLVADGRVSFPSQHAAISAFLGAVSISFFVLFMVGLVLNQSRRWKIVLISLAVVGSLVLLAPSTVISATRYTDNRHFPSDIVAGYFFGLVPGLFSVPLYRYFQRKFKYSKWSDLRIHCRATSESRKDHPSVRNGPIDNYLDGEIALSCVYTNSSHLNKEVKINDHDGKHIEGANEAIRRGKEDIKEDGLSQIGVEEFIEKDEMGSGFI